MYRSNNYHNQNINRVPKRIYVGGIPDDASQDELRDYFSNFGTVVDARIILDPIGHSRGYGFVTFDQENEASRVLGLGEDKLTFKENKLQVGQAFKNNPRNGMHNTNGINRFNSQTFNLNPQQNGGQFNRSPSRSNFNNSDSGSPRSPRSNSNYNYRQNQGLNTSNDGSMNQYGMKFAYDQQYNGPMMESTGRFYRN